MITLDSLLSLPPNWEDRPEAWQALTAGDALFDALHAAVRARAAYDWARLGAIAAQWKEAYVDYCPMAEHVRLAEQWQLARAMLWCAEQAATHPDFYQGELDRVRFALAAAPEFIKRDEGWAWVCVRTLLDAPGRDAVTVPVALWERPGEGGAPAALVLEVLPGGAGQVVRHPADAFATRCDAEFDESMCAAWTAAQALARAEGTDARRCDGRWRLLRAGLPVADVRGGSAGGAALWGWWHALLGRCPDDGVVVLASLAPAGDGVVPAGVSGVPDKVASIVAGPCDTIVVASADDRREAAAALRKSGRAGEIRVLPLDPATPQALVAVRSQLAEELQAFYAQLAERLDRTPWHRAGQPVPASALAVTAHVRKSHGGDLSAETAWPDEWPGLARAVVTGPPGGGKSFLLTATALQLIQAARAQLQARDAPLDELPLPALCSLADLAASAGGAEPEDALLGSLGRQVALSPRLAAWIRAQLPRPATWLLLDGLEAVEDARRTVLRDWLQSLDAHGWGCRVVLTCRAASYARGLVPWGRLSEYELAPLDAQESAALVARWFGPDDPRGAALQHALAVNPALQDTCRSPLLAALACLAHAEGELPEDARRVDLYARVLRSLARGAWQAVPPQRNDAYVDDRLHLLEHVARALFTGAPERQAYGNDELLAALRSAPALPVPRVLRRQAAAQGLPSGYEAQVPALLRDELLADDLLVAAGMGPAGGAQFAFTHRVFAEYLVACNLAREVAQNGWPALAAPVDRWAWDPVWQPVITLLAGKLDDPLPLLAQLSDPRVDDAFRHRLALAAACVRECLSLKPRRHTKEHEGMLAAAGSQLPAANLRVPSCAFVVSKTSSSSEDASLADDLASAAWALWWQHLWTGTEAAVPHLACALADLAQAGARIEGVSVPAWAYRQLRAAERGLRTRAAAFWQLAGPAAARDAEVVPGLLAALGDPDAAHREWAAETLGALGAVRHPDAAAALAARVLADADGAVRARAAEALGQLGASATRDPAVLAALVHALGGADHAAQHWALAALERLGAHAAAHDDVVPALHAALAGADDDELRAQAARALGRMGPALAGHAEVLAALAASAVYAESPEAVREGATYALGLLGAAAAKPGVFAVLLKALQSADDATRRRAVDALAQLGAPAGRDARVHAALLHALGDDSPMVRGRAALVLSRTADLTPDVVAALLDAVLAETDGAARAEALEALGELGPVAARYPAVLAALAGRAMQDAARPARHAAAQALARLGEAAAVAGRATESSVHVPASSEVIVALAACLRDQDALLRYYAALALGQMGAAAGDPLVLPLLLACARGDADGTVRAQAVAALGNVAGRPEVVPALVAVAEQDGDIQVCARAVAVLAGVPDALAQHPGVLDALAATLAGADPWLRAAAAGALGQAGAALAGHPIALGALLARLADPVEAVRGAAAEALARVMAAGVRVFARGGRWEARRVAEPQRAA